jgi:hypothetical protein
MVKGLLFVPISILFILEAAGCELVLGGPDQATIGSPDAMSEGGPIADGGDADVGLEASVRSDVTPGDAGAEDAKVKDTSGPCMLPSACMTTEQQCNMKCLQTFPCLPSLPPGQNKKCEDELQACEAACTSACEACAPCSDPMPACTAMWMLP